MSQRFFSKGEEQEANGYEGVILDDETAPELEFDSFDRIPRRRRPLLAITALLVSLPVIGFVTWKSTGGFGSSGSSVNEGARAMVAGQPAPTDMPGSSPPAGVQPGGPGGPATPEPSPAVMAGTCQPPATEPAAAAPIAPSPTAEEPAPSAKPVVAAAPKLAPPAKPETTSDAELEPRTEKAQAETRPSAETAEAEAASPPESASSRAAHKTRSSSALRGYVWSPEANALVPAGAPQPPEPGAAPTTEPSVAPTSASSASPAQEPRVAPAPRIAPTPSTSPAREPLGAPAPRIAPPETGPLPAEKAPIIE